jgi:NAD(P)-dependent dehydrogenase (short-subunit alcohol dehydrogenase family)
MPLPITPSFDLHGRRALVVGASRGLGAASACALAEAGADVFLCARSGADLQQLGLAMSERFKDAVRIDTQTLDITEARQVRDFFAQHGAFDVLVQSAGANRPKPLLETSDQDIEDILRLNTIACLQVLREAAAAWLQRDRSAQRTHASFMVLSSQMGHVGSPRRSVYCASKHALEGMTKSLAWEWASIGIRVNTICPTFIHTPLTQPMLSQPEFHRFVTERIANGEVGVPEDVMGAVRFLASDASRLMTGSALMLDGGWSAT